MHSRLVWAQWRIYMHSHAPIQRIACCNSPSKLLCSRPSQMSKEPALLAIVVVPPSKAVSCQAPGCGHRVYAAVHVVEDGGQTLVLGSTCYAKRYGSSSALGSPKYTSGGSGGKALTDEERDLLAANAAELSWSSFFRHSDRGSSFKLSELQTPDASRSYWVTGIPAWSAA